MAKEKNVRLWLWAHWSSIDRNDTYLQAFPLYEKWGIAGVKIDFMNRDDQEMVNWYEKIVKAAAEHHIMVNFHGAFKPTGMIRTYPNQITREGILGNEYNRWSARIPQHKTTLPLPGCLPARQTSPRRFLNKQLDQFEFNVSSNRSARHALRRAGVVRLPGKPNPRRRSSEPLSRAARNRFFKDRSNGVG